MLVTIFLTVPVSGLTKQLPDFSSLVEKTRSAVVNITVEKNQLNTKKRTTTAPFDEFFRRFSPPPQPSPRTPRFSRGSGFVISQDGYIITNHHLANDAKKITVKFADRTELEAIIIGSDEFSDIALLKVEVKKGKLKTVKLGASEDIKVGEWVAAIGSPFGFEHSVTQGIVSATSRSIPSVNNSNYVPFIQTDVAINPGNSGGPLFNLDGEVIGINSQIYTRTGSYSGISFAIPIDIATEVVEQLRETGKMVRGWLGVVIQEVNKELADSFNLDKPRGTLISRVAPSGPAEKAGLKPGDLILAVDGKKIDLSSDLPHLVGRIKPGKTIRMKILRNGKNQTIRVTLGNLEDSNDPFLGASNESKVDVLGITIANLSEQTLERLKSSNLTNGIRITSVLNDGVIAKSGLLRGDIIVAVNNTKIDSIDTFQTLLRSLRSRGKGNLRFYIFRSNRYFWIAITIP